MLFISGQLHACIHVHAHIHVGNQESGKLDALSVTVSKTTQANLYYAGPQGMYMYLCCWQGAPYSSSYPLQAVRLSQLVEAKKACVQNSWNLSRTLESVSSFQIRSFPSLLTSTSSGNFKLFCGQHKESYKGKSSRWLFSAVLHSHAQYYTHAYMVDAHLVGGYSCGCTLLTISVAENKHHYYKRLYMYMYMYYLLIAYRYQHIQCTYM